MTEVIPGNIFVNMYTFYFVLYNTNSIRSSPTFHSTVTESLLSPSVSSKNPETQQDSEETSRRITDTRATCLFCFFALTNIFLLS